MNSAVMPAPMTRHSDGSKALSGQGRTAIPDTSNAVVFLGTHNLQVQTLGLSTPGPEDVVVAVEWSGVSTGTERLLWAGEMPAFPGLSYPLVPGYEAVGRVVVAEARPDLIGRRVFVPGSRGFKGAAGLFGASASHLVVAAEKVVPVDLDRPSDAVLLALAATAYHAIDAAALPELIVGHGVLGRLMARLTRAMGGMPTVWEINADRLTEEDYPVCTPESDGRRDYGVICDVSGDSGILDSLIARLAPKGEIVMAGFYMGRPDFAFPAAFMKEVRLRIAAEWAPEDLESVLRLISGGVLRLDGLVTHSQPASEAAKAYQVAFADPSCLKMILDWRHIS